MNNTLWRRLSGDDSAHCKDSNECFSFSRCLSRRFGGHLYALIALAFVVAYKASRVINFALGKWQMLATLLVATGLHVLGLDLAVAMAIACAGMFVYAFLFNSLVLRHLVGQPLISLLMVTLGVGALIRGVAQLPSGSVPGGILLPIPSEPLVVNALRIPADKLVAALVAASSIALVAWFHQRSRTGVALRAQQPMINKRPWRSASMYLATS